MNLGAARITPNVGSKRGTISVIFGPMFSGKSTELLRRIRRQTIASRACLIFKYKHDKRYSENEMATHDKVTWAAQPATELLPYTGLAAGYDVIGIDEGQFFSDVVQFCESMANAGKSVIVAALDGTFQRKPFASILELVPLAESVTKLSAICMQCSAEAAFSKRTGSETQIEVIGGADKYIAVCRKCYLDEPAGEVPKPVGMTFAQAAAAGVKSVQPFAGAAPMAIQFSSGRTL